MLQTLDKPLNLDDGVALHQAGDLDGAARIYRGVLAANPRDAAALHLLGLAEDAYGRTLDGIRMLEQAVAIRPDPTILANLAALLSKLNRDVEAMAAAGRAVVVKPDHPEALNNMGVALLHVGAFEEAANAFGRAAAARPGYHDALKNQAEALLKFGRPAEAVAPLEKALEMRPGQLDLLVDLAKALREANRREDCVMRWRQVVALAPDDPHHANNLACALSEAKKHAEAVPVLEEVVRKHPDFLEARTNLSNALLGCKRLTEAEAVAREALGRFPHAVDALGCLGMALSTQDKLVEALSVFRQAAGVVANPMTLGNLAMALHDCGHLEETLEEIERALKMAPGNADLYMHKSLTLLEMGRFDEGWSFYEHRFETGQAKEQHVLSMPVPSWRGEDLKGGTLLLRAEQGLGDTIQFLRYVPMAAKRAGKVVLEIPAPLRRLVENYPGVDQLFDPGGTVVYQAQCPLLSLPRAFGTNLENIPAKVPYLKPPKAARTAWKQRLGPKKGRRIAFTWAGNPIHPKDFRRSLDFGLLAPWWEIPGISWYSVQLGERVADLKQAPAGRITDLSPHLTDMAETAAAFELMDLIIAPDTSVAHLAGALGRPVWVLIPSSPDWRWMRGRDDSPWYPSMRLFRQESHGDWPGVIERVVRALG